MHYTHAVGIGQDNLSIVENEKLKKYDILTSEIAMLYIYSTKTTPYVTSWDIVVVKYYKQYFKEFTFLMEVEEYKQGIIFKNAWGANFFGEKKMYLRET